VGGPGRPYWLGAAVLVLGGVWLHGGLTLPQTAGYAVIGPGLVPALVGAGLLGLGALLLVAIARGERFHPQETEDVEAGRPPDRRALWLCLLASALPVALVRPLGFPPAAAITFALVARAFGSRRPVADTGLGLLLGVGCWLLFSRLLGLALPGLPAALAR
jgi:putative tricarboxylic transport membrane protein